jgi:hypothetical protein
MIAKDKTRIVFTASKDVADWIDAVANHMHMTRSGLLSFFIVSLKNDVMEMQEKLNIYGYEKMDKNSLQQQAARGRPKRP